MKLQLTRSRRFARCRVAVAITLIAAISPACSEREPNTADSIAAESTTAAITVNESALAGTAVPAAPDAKALVEQERRLQAVFRGIKPGMSAAQVNAMMPRGPSTRSDTAWSYKLMFANSMTERDIELW